MVDGVMVHDASEVAIAHQDHYVGAYSNPRFGDVLEMLSSWTEPDKTTILRDVEITESSMRVALRNLAERSALGPDDTPTILLKK